MNAVSPEYGRYEYSTILQRRASHGFVVVSEGRAPNTDPEAYAETVAKQIRHLADSGVSTRHISKEASMRWIALRTPARSGVSVAVRIRKVGLVSEDGCCAAARK